MQVDKTLRVGWGREGLGTIKRFGGSGEEEGGNCCCREKNLGERKDVF